MAASDAWTGLMSGFRRAANVADRPIADIDNVCCLAGRSSDRSARRSDTCKGLQEKTLVGTI
ncbi:MAG: hypothetical protein EBR82_05100 [Caulobacteraceae bacterium]|nr:hypothetical protein [Caulobacteraceae bacterium]